MFHNNYDRRDVENPSQNPSENSIFYIQCTIYLHSKNIILKVKELWHYGSYIGKLPLNINSFDSKILYAKYCNPEHITAFFKIP